MKWSVEFLDKSALDVLRDLPSDIQASFARIVGLIEGYGLERVREPYVKHLEGRLWEMRMKGRDGIARAAYVTAIGRRVVVVRVFPKKTQKTPPKDVTKAIRAKKEYEQAEKAGIVDWRDEIKKTK